jgi:hypothetical protein
MYFQVSDGRASRYNLPSSQAGGRTKVTTVGVFVVTAGCLAVLAALVLDLTGIWRRAARFRWQLTGLLLVGSVALARGVALLAGWPGSRLSTLTTATFPVMLAGFLFLLFGAFREQRRSATRRRESNQRN